MSTTYSIISTSPWCVQSNTLAVSDPILQQNLSGADPSPPLFPQADLFPPEHCDCISSGTHAPLWQTTSCTDATPPFFPEYAIGSAAGTAGMSLCPWPKVPFEHAEHTSGGTARADLQATYSPCATPTLGHNAISSMNFTKPRPSFPQQSAGAEPCWHASYAPCTDPKPPFPPELAQYLPAGVLNAWHANLLPCVSTSRHQEPLPPHGPAGRPIFGSMNIVHAANVGKAYNTEHAAFLQASGNGRATSSQSTPQPPSSQPKNAQLNGAYSNGKPATPQSSTIFTRLGVPTSRPTPQGPESRTRTSAAAASTSPVPQPDLDHFPPGFATAQAAPHQQPAKVDFRQAEGGQGRPEARDALPSSQGIMYSDRTQPPQAGRLQSPSLALPTASVQPTQAPGVPDSASNSSLAANDGSEDLPPGFAKPGGAPSQNGGLTGRSNGSASLAMPTALNGKGATAGIGHGHANGAAASHSRSSQGAWPQANSNWAEVSTQ